MDTWVFTLILAGSLAPAVVSLILLKDEVIGERNLLGFLLVFLHMIIALVTAVPYVFVQEALSGGKYVFPRMNFWGLVFFFIWMLILWITDVLTTYKLWENEKLIIAGWKIIFGFIIAMLSVFPSGLIYSGAWLSTRLSTFEYASIALVGIFIALLAVALFPDVIMENSPKNWRPLGILPLHPDEAVEDNPENWRPLGIFLLSFIIGLLIMYPYPPILTFAGVFLFFVGAGILLVGVASSALVAFIEAENKSYRKELTAIAVLSILAISTAVYFSYSLASVEYGSLQRGYKTITITRNYTTAPLPEVGSLRLVDRKLARDLISSFTPPPPPKNYSIEKMLDAEVIGLVEGEPSWIVPVRYQYSLADPAGTNLIVGFIWVPLKYPIPENIRYEYYQMDVGAGLSGFRGLSYWVQVHFPEYSLGEYYLIREGGVWFWVCLLDYWNGAYYETRKVVLVYSWSRYEELTPEEAVSRGVPQVFSGRMLKTLSEAVGSNIRGGMLDITASGVLFLKPRSPDIWSEIGIDFYRRPHHFLIGGGWFGRDYYLELSLGGFTSIVVVTLVNTTITAVDLRGYSMGRLSGVSLPDRTLEELRSIVNETIGWQNIAVRYPKLYRVSDGNNTYIVWLALVVEERRGAGDIFRGVVFTDAVDQRIRGIVQYTYGEPWEVFVDRVEDWIINTYYSFMHGGNQTEVTVKTGVIPNGTVLSKGWVFEGSGEDMEFVLTFRVLNESSVVVVVAKEEYMASREEWYLASTLQEGDRVYMELRYSPEKQVWILYHLKILG